MESLTTNETINAILKVVPKDYSNDESLNNLINYISNHTVNNYFFGAGCSCIPTEAISDFINIRELYNRTDGIMLKHFVISFEPNENINIDTIPIIANQIVNYFYGSHQVAYAIHEKERNYEYAYHIHLIINYINYINGNLYHNSFTTINNFISYIESLPYNIKVQKANNYF